MKANPLAFSFLLATAFCTACSTLARPFTGPDAEFSGVGGAIGPDDDLPLSDTCVPKGLRVTIDSSLMDAAFRGQLVDQLRSTSGGRYASVRDEKKDPQFELLVTEMTNNKNFELSKVGAIVGGLGGGVGGAAADRWGGRGAVIGGLAGAAGGWLLFSKQQDTWAFEVKFKQRTSAAGHATIQQKQIHGTHSGGGLTGNTGVGAAGSSLNEQVKNVDFEVASNTAVQTRYFAVAVEGGAFSTVEGRKEAARKVLLERLPSYLMGGNVVDF